MVIRFIKNSNLLKDLNPKFKSTTQFKVRRSSEHLKTKNVGESYPTHLESAAVEYLHKTNFLNAKITFEG